ncbi:fungal trichothecene efflux pump [Colletotrichum higginsianum]|nr:fungal trichothecene efflux pump [Colletotrichum higginsianum]
MDISKSESYRKLDRPSLDKHCDLDRDDASSIRSEALGDDLPLGYYYSPRFLGAMAVGWRYRGPSPYISWVNIARTLSLSFTYTILGRLSDLFGRRWFFIGGNVVAFFGVIICAVARNVETLIVGAAVYGLGETVQLSFNVAVGELVPNKYRPMVLSLIFLTNAPVSAFGPFIDIGIFLWTTGLTLLLLGVSWGGVMFPWGSPATISSLTMGTALLVALFCWEAFANLKYPAIPVKFFSNRGFMSLVCCATVATMFYYSAVLLWPQQVQALYTTDITYGGWLSSTVASSTALGQVCAGGIIKWGGNVRYWIIFATFAMVGFVGALASLTPETLNLGIALTILGPFFPSDIGLASGLLASIRSAGGSIAVAVYTTILSNRLATEIPAAINGPASAAGLSQSQLPALAKAAQAGKLAAFPGLTSAVKAAVVRVLPSAYTKAFETVYLASLGFGAIAIVGCLFAKDAQKHMTNKVERRMGDGKSS